RSSDLRLSRDTARRSGQRGPEPQPRAVDQAVGPDPDQLAVVDLDLADALHAGPQPAGRIVERRLDAEAVLAVLGRVDRGDLADGEGEALLRDRRHRQAAALADGDVGELVLVDIKR